MELIIVIMIMFMVKAILYLLVSIFNPELMDSINEPDDTHSEAWLRWAEKQEKDKID